MFYQTEFYAGESRQGIMIRNAERAAQVVSAVENVARIIKNRVPVQTFPHVIVRASVRGEDKARKKFIRRTRKHFVPSRRGALQADILFYQFLVTCIKRQVIGAG